MSFYELGEPAGAKDKVVVTTNTIDDEYIEAVPVPSLPGQPIQLLSPNIKDTNPKDAVGVKKAPVSTVSAGVIMELGLAMLEGARKYGRHNYRESGVRASVYYDAAWRHITAFWDFGQDVDPDSGISHVTKAIASLMVLRDAMMIENWIDDRPPPLPISLLKEFNKQAAAIILKHPDAKEPVTNESLKSRRDS